MPVTPSLFEQLIMLKLNQGPGPLLDLLGSMACKAVAIALRLDIFDTIGSGRLTAAEVAGKINADERGTALLLQALEAAGYVEKKGDSYVNSPMTAKWMLRSSPMCIADYFPYFEGVLERWDYLDKAIRDGKTPMLAWEWLDQHPNGWERYSAVMMSEARTAGEEIVAKAKLPSTARRLIDIGGGHGLHAINFCQRYPALSATILDWPQTKQLAETNIAAAGIDGRVAFQEGDMWKTDLGNNYDAALMFNVIHMYRSDENIDLINRVAGALNPGATLIVMDQMATKSSGPISKAMAGLVGLDLFVEVNGQTYPPKEVTGWLSKAGFTKTQWIPLRSSPGNALVTGTKEG